MALRIFLLLTLTLQACGGELAHENPFDPFTPAEKQAKGELIGRVTLEAETDSSEVEVQLLNDVRTYSVSTAADGSVRLTGIVPGQYRLSLQTRYFEPVTRTVDISLGSTHDLGTVTLAARRAVVSGVATAEVYSGESLVRRGGVVVRLVRKASVRTAAAAAPGVAFARSAASEVSYEATSRSNGQFEISGVTPGIYDATADAEGAAPATVGEVRVVGEAVEITEFVGRPLSGFFVIDGLPFIEGTYVSASGVVDLLLTQSGATSVAVGSVAGAADGCAYGEPKPVAPTVSHAIAFEGLNTICVRFYTADGQSFDAAPRTVLVDSTPPTGAISIADGDEFVRATDGAVFLSLTANDSVSGVGSMKVANAASIAGCPAALASAAAEPFVASRSWQLLGAGVGVEGERYVCALFADKAGNWTTIAQVDSVRYDTKVPVATVAVTGPEAVVGRTRSYEVTVSVSGQPADATEMMIGNDASFSSAGWRTLGAATAWLLLPGDGLKTVYVKVRDEAGNESPVYQPTITLDQTAPDVPGITMEDLDGDGFALSGDSIELRWTKPSDADLDGFELQRYVPGVDSGFVTIALPGASEETYVDAVTETSGVTHFYRVRTRDTLGNTSAWSLTVQAFPYQPIATAAWLWTGSGYRYLFPPSTGTFSIRSSHAYLDFERAEFSDELPADAPSWDRPETLNAYFDETFTIRTLNQDNSLSYLGTFHGQLKQRLRIDPSTYNPGIAIAPDGSSHLVYDAAGADAFRHARVANGTVEIADIDVNVVEYNPEIVVDANNHAHVVYTRYLNSPNRELRYATNASGQWVTQTIVATTTSYNFYPRITLGPDGKPRLLYRKNTNQLYYASPATDGPGWDAEFVSTSPSLFEYAFAVSSDASAHILNCSGHYWTNQSGTWVSTALADYPDMACTPAIEVGDDNQLHAAWHNRLDTMIRYATSADGWSIQDVESFTPYVMNSTVVPESVDLAVFDGRPYVSFTDYDAPGGDVHRIAYKNGAVWSTHDVDAIQSEFDGSSIAIDPEGNVRLAYSLGGEAYLYTGFSLTAPRIKATIPATLSDLAMAVDANGQPHFLTYKSGPLTYRTFVNGTWGSTSFGFTAFSVPGIAVDEQDRPHVVSELFSGALKTSYLWKNGGVWEQEDIASAMRPTIMADAEGGIHVLYSEAGDIPLKYRYRAPGASGLGAAETVVAEDAYNGRAARDTAGTVHIAYLVNPSYKLRYAWKSGGTWINEAIDESAKADRYVVTTHGETPYVLYIDRNTERLYVASRVDGVWKRSTLASGVIASGQWGQQQALSMQFDAAGRVYAMYYNYDRETFYLGFNPGGRWVFTPLAKGSMVGAAQLDPQGQLHFAHQSGGSDGYKLYYQTGIFGLLHPSSVERVSAW
jgi:hypothetical protein